MDRIFICYRRDDAGGYVGTLHDDLRREFGNQIFRDVERSLPGDRFKRRIDRVLARCDVVAVIIGPGWLVRDAHGARRLDDPGDLVRREIATALSREDVAVVPVLVGGASQPRSSELPADLRPLLDCTLYRINEGPQRKGDVKFLSEVIRREIDAATAVPAVLTALLAAALLLLPVRAAADEKRESWGRPDELGLQMLRLGALHAFQWAIIAAVVAVGAAYVSRGGRCARRAAIVGAVAGALGGFVGGAIDQGLRDLADGDDVGIVVGWTITVAIASTAGLIGRSSAASILAATIGAFVGALLVVRGQNEFWAFAAPVVGAMLGLALVRLVSAHAHRPLRMRPRPRADVYGDAQATERPTVQR